MILLLLVNLIARVKFSPINDQSMKSPPNVVCCDIIAGIDVFHSYDPFFLNQVYTHQPSFNIESNPVLSLIYSKTIIMLHQYLGLKVLNVSFFQWHEYKKCKVNKSAEATIESTISTVKNFNEAKCSPVNSTSRSTASLSVEDEKKVCHDVVN